MKNFFRDLVLPEMDRLVSSPEHMKMFKKASKDACCSSSCKCDESCTCKKCDKDCSKCDLGKVASSQDIVTNLLSLSETLESRNLVKSNALLLDFVDGMVSVAQCGDDSNDIQALDVLRGPTTEDFIGEEIRPLEEELDELESSPGYEDLDQILKDPELSKMFGEIRGKNQLDKEMANFTTSLSDIIDEDDDMEDAEKYIDNMNAKDHKWRKAEKILRIDSALFDDLSDSEKEIIEFSNKHIKNNVNVSKEELHFINENNYVEDLKNTINKLNEIVESDLQPVESLIIHKILNRLIDIFELTNPNGKKLKHNSKPDYFFPKEENNTDEYIDNLNAEDDEDTLEDYETCATCGFDHEYEPEEAVKVFHIDAPVFDELSTTEKEIVQLINKNLNGPHGGSDEELQFILENNYENDLTNALAKLDHVVELEKNNVKEFESNIPAVINKVVNRLDDIAQNIKHNYVKDPENNYESFYNDKDELNELESLETPWKGEFKIDTNEEFEDLKKNKPKSFYNDGDELDELESLVTPWKGEFPRDANDGLFFDEKLNFEDEDYEIPAPKNSETLNILGPQDFEWDELLSIKQMILRKMQNQEVPSENLSKQLEAITELMNAMKNKEIDTFEVDNG